MVLAWKGVLGQVTDLSTILRYEDILLESLSAIPL